MRFLVDNALSPVLATVLSRAGHDALHVRTIELQRAEDIVIIDKTAADDRIVVSADTDLGALLAARNVQKPSVIQFRGPGRPCDDGEAPAASVGAAATPARGEPRLNRSDPSIQSAINMAQWSHANDR